jgi:DNA-binding MarR family transcriptional regulator
MQPDTSDNNPGATTTQVLRRFRVVFNAVRSHFQQVENRVGLGGAQVWALALVRDQPSIGMGELAKSMDIHQSTASNLIKILLRKAFIRQDKAPGDRRNVQLTITPAGLEVLNQVPGPFEGVLPMALGKLPPASLQRLDEDLAELIALLKADETAGSIPLAEM